MLEASVPLSYLLLREVRVGGQEVEVGLSDERGNWRYDNCVLPVTISREKHLPPSLARQAETGKMTESQYEDNPL